MNSNVSEGFFSRKPKPKPTKAVYGGAEAAEKAKKLAAAKKGLVPGKGFQGRFDQYGREYDTKTGKLKEARLSYYGSKEQRKDEESEKLNKERDLRMKHGKNWKQFTRDVESAKKRLRPGEVRKYDKETGKWVSNKD